MTQNAFWDVEDMTEPVKVRDTFVGPASPGDVGEFCRRYHYARGQGHAMARWGLWHGPTLLGVIAYNNGNKNAGGSLLGVEHEARVWHMGRLSMADAAPRNSESRLIAGSLRALQDERPDVWAILTYAATGQGHIGYVYQATNALYTGMTGEERYFLDENGVRRSRHQTRDSSGYSNVTTAAATARGWSIQRDAAKHRYVYILGNKRERRERMKLLRYPILPYPKADAAAAS